jgi:winged helix-turn helix protein
VDVPAQEFEAKKQSLFPARATLPACTGRIANVSAMIHVIMGASSIDEVTRSPTLAGAGRRSRRCFDGWVALGASADGAGRLGNVSKACKLMGYHRDTFYEVRRAFQVGGVAASHMCCHGPRIPY